VEAMLESLKNEGIRVALFSSELVVHFKFPGLVVHSADDNVIPIAIGQRVAQSWPGCRFAGVDQLGHRGILTNKAVIELVTDFISDWQLL
jgi:predicted alpha/beta hydrolase family esterase